LFRQQAHKLLIESILFGRSKNADATNLARKSEKSELQMPAKNAFNDRKP